MKKVMALLLISFLFGGNGFSQGNLGFRWVQQVLPESYTIFGWGIPGLSSVSKRGNQICFVDSYMFDPLEVLNNGMILPMQENAFGMPPGICGNSGTFLLNDLKFSLLGEPIRNYTYYPFDFFENPNTSLLYYKGNYNFDFSSYGERSFPCQYLKGNQNQYEFGFGIQRKANCTSWSCPHLQTLFINVYNSGWGLVKSYFQQPYPFALQNAILTKSREGLPMVSFQSLDSVEWKGTKWSTNGPAHVQLILNDSLDIIRQYQFPLVVDTNFVGQLYQGNEGHTFRIGNRQTNGEKRAEIQRLDSLGQVKWAYQRSQPEMLTGFKMDPAGNCLLFLKEEGSPMMRLAILSKDGVETWRYADSTQSFNHLEISSFEAVDTLEWAFSGRRGWPDTTSQFQFGPIHLQIDNQEFIGLIGRQPQPQPLLSMDIQASGCSQSNTRLVIENQGLNYGPNNQFVVELSDSSGHFGLNPTVLSTGPEFIKNFNLPAGITPGLHYKIRTRATVPDTIGPARPFPIYPMPAKPILVASGEELQVCAQSNRYIKPLNPQAGVQYRWSEQTFGDSLQVNGNETINVTAILGNCSVTSDYVWVTIINPEVFLFTTPTICADQGPTQLDCNWPGGYWTGPQIDSSGLFTPLATMDTLEVVYHTKAANCKVNQPFTLYQFPRPILQPVADTTACMNFSWQLPTQGQPGEYWFGPKVNNGVFNSGSQSGQFTIIHAAGSSGCQAMDTVVVQVRNADFPACKAGLDTLGNLQTIMELGGNICQTNRTYKTWAHWAHNENDAERPYRLEFSTQANDFSNPVFQNQQLIPFFSGNLNLAPGKYFFRVSKLNPMESGPVDSLQLFALPSKPTIVKTGPSSYCPGDAINQTKYYVAHNPDITHIWAPGNVVGDTLVPNSIGSFTVRAMNAACTSAVSNAQTIVYKSLGTFNMTSPAKVCLPAAPFQLQSNVASPTWIGTQVDSTTGIFYPANVPGNAVIQGKKVLNGCLVIKPFEIAQWNKPPVGPNFSFQTCPDLGPITLDGKPAGGTWSGNGLVGQTTFYSSISGVFSLVYTTQNSQCTNSDTIVVQVLGGNPLTCFTQVADEELVGKFEISPNPVKQDFVLKLPGSGNCTLILINTLGQAIFSKEWIAQSSEEQLRLPYPVSSGIYTLLIKLAGKQQLERLVIE